MSVFDNLRAREQTAAASYAQTVEAIAGGEEPPADQVAAVLTAAGKTVAELERDAAAAAHRNRLREVVERLPALDAELVAANEQIAAFQAKQARLAAEARAESFPLLARKQQIADEMSLCRQAEAELRQLHQPADVGRKFMEFWA